MKTKTSIILFLNFAIICIQYSIGQQKDKVEGLSNLIGKLYVNGTLHGGVLVAEGQDILYRDAWGLANIDQHTALTVDEKFTINSMGKMFTSILILQLVEEGKLDFEDKLSDMLPEFQHKRVKDITLHHLLAHRSGIRDYGLLQMAGQLPYNLTRDQMLAEIGKMDLKFEPGSKFNYSNSGYMLLGAIIENNRGKSLQEVMQERIFEPLGMRNTSMIYTYDLDELPQYFLQDGTIYQEDDVVIYGGDGAEVSTMDDMYTFMMALGSDTLLSKAMWELAFTPHSFPNEVPEDAWPPPHQDPYGYGFSIMELPFDGETTARAVGHGGAGLGSNYALRFLDSKRIIVNWNNIFKNPILFDVITYLATSN
ncbi:serine hydrolase [Muricauda sp. HICW]|uniref:Serine hydrolase n=1 Tax=Flagellimonas chongwuensis TaxID=2697365 RepID=A0A850NCS3_9FLAO|nr:serine hydrolase domain-containing protein [Allomuricauda chongwuensis]NVN18553.1 serine hydrolase [Allomuricauda chongwuensis]